jgi:citrate synthase
MQTSLGKAELHRVLIRGHDLTGELLGRASYTDMLALMLLGRLPEAGERRMLDALLVVLIEHGMVKSVVVSRFIYSNAPESLQAAVAGALLGAGSRHLGSSEWCARMLQEAISAHGDTGEAVTRAIVADFARRRERIPGIGHRTHGEGDPRAERLFAIARETGTYGRHCALLEGIAKAAEERHGRRLPVNVTGAIAAIASDMGFRWEITRGFALLGRALGALAHIQEELDTPLSDRLIEYIRAETGYRPTE